MGVCLTGVLLATLDPELASILTRVSEEAHVFSLKSPQYIGVERMRHQGRSAPPRFRVRTGVDPALAPQSAFRATEIVSEYSFGALKSAPGELRELRRVVSVNGKAVRTKQAARLELAQGMSGDTDRINKQMLLELEAHGLVGAATDMGQMLLLFQRDSLPAVEFEIRSRNETWNGEPAVVLAYRQADGDAPKARIYHGRELSRVALSGELWVRKSDGLPLRVTADLPVQERKHPVIHQMSVDYAPSAQGVLLPVRAAYTRVQDQNPQVETTAEYTDFKMFSADAEIKFLAEGEEPK